MGRKLNVALLLAMHLGFFVCAGLIVGPLLTDGANQGGETNIAVNQSKLGSEVDTDVRSQENMAELRFQEEYSNRLDLLGQTFNQKLVEESEKTDPQLREARRPYARRLGP